MKIAEVCAKHDITADTLRYYEKVGLLPKIGRTSGGIRDYTDNDCWWIEFIKYMRNAGVSVASILEYMTLYEHGAGTGETRKQILIKERGAMLERQTALQIAIERLDEKIKNYETVIIPTEEQLRRSSGKAESGDKSKRHSQLYDHHSAQETIKA